MKAWQMALIVVVVLAVAGGGFAIYNKLAGSETPELAPGEEIVEVRRGTLDITVEASGKITMPQQVKLSFGVSGLIETLNVEIGDQVKKGQLLAQMETDSFERAVAEARWLLSDVQIALDKLLNPSNLAADIRGAEADVESARAALIYAEEIYVGEGQWPVGLSKKSQVKSAEAALIKAEEKLADLLDGPDERDVQQAENEVAKAELALEEAEKQLEEAAIVAPFDGIAGEVNVKLGDRIMAMMAYETIILLIDTTQPEVEGIVDELDILQVKQGQECRVSFDAVPDIEFRGRVKTISPVAYGEAGVINYPVWITVEPPADLILREGLTASVDIIVQRKEDVLLVPYQAVGMSKEKPVVRIIVHGQPEEREVRIGLSNDQWTEIVEGLEEGDQVVVKTTTRRQTGFFGM